MNALLMLSENASGNIWLKSWKMKEAEYKKYQQWDKYRTVTESDIQISLVAKN